MYEKVSLGAKNICLEIQISMMINVVSCLILDISNWSVMSEWLNSLSDSVDLLDLKQTSKHWGGSTTLLHRLFI